MHARHTSRSPPLRAQPAQHVTDSTSTQRRARARASARAPSVACIACVACMHPHTHSHATSHFVAHSNTRRSCSQLVFAILGMQLFMGAFGACTDPTIQFREACHAPPSAPPFPPGFIVYSPSPPGQVIWLATDAVRYSALVAPHISHRAPSPSHPAPHRPHLPPPQPPARKTYLGAVESLKIRTNATPHADQLLGL